MLSISLIAAHFDDIRLIEIDKKDLIKIHFITKDNSISKMSDVKSFTLETLEDTLKKGLGKRYNKVGKKNDITIAQLSKIKKNLEKKLSKKTYAYVFPDSSFIEIGYIEGNDESATLVFDSAKIFKKYFDF